MNKNKTDTKFDVDKDQANRKQINDLRKMRIIATSILILLTLIFIITRPFRDKNIVIALLNAFSEAGMIGALADWFAVVALFRYPLGIPIPHTAIVPHSKAKLGKYLSGFILSNFLNEENIKIKINEINVTGTLIKFIEDNRPVIIDNIISFIPHAVELLENIDMKKIFADGVETLLNKLPVNKFVTDLLDTLIEKGEHQKVLTFAVKAGIRLLEKENETIRDIIHEKLPVGTKTILTDLVTKEVIRMAESILNDILTDPKHSARVKFHDSIVDYVGNLQNEKEIPFIAKLKNHILNDITLHELYGDIWAKLKNWSLNDAGGDDSKIRSFLERIIDGVIRSIMSNTSLYEKIDLVIHETVGNIVIRNVTVIGNIITDTFERWDEKTMSEKIEQQVGKDLQYIRINGSLVGGLVGVLIYIFSEIVFKFFS
jgi:uncharacterized membrane-anchored protein YjiN (DUF445 family)